MKTRFITLIFLCLISFAALHTAPAALAAEAIKFTDFEGVWLADLGNSVNLNIPAEDLDLYKEFTVTIDTKTSTMVMAAGPDFEETSTIENTTPGEGNTLQFNMDGHSLVMKKFGPDSIAIIDGSQIFMFSRVK